MTIGDRVKLLREQKGMTQEDLAQKLGYKNKSSVTHIEKGRDIPRSMVVKLADILETTPQYLMGWDEHPTFPPNRLHAHGATLKPTIRKIAPDEIKDDLKQNEVLKEMSTEELLALLDDVTKALKDKQHNQAD